jgi:hypothetical protein
MSSFDQLTELENSVQSVADAFSHGSGFRNDLERIADGITPPIAIKAMDNEVINLTDGLVYIGDQLARVVDRLEVIADAMPLVEN